MPGNPSITLTAISGFNSSPPADDGSQVAANQTKWSDHVIAKVGTPLKNYAETNLAAVETAIESIRQYWSQQESKSANFSVSATADDGKFYAVSGSTTVTLPSAVTAGANYRFTIHKTDASNNITISPSGGQTINGLSSVVLYTQYESITLISNGTNWYAVQQPGIVSGSWTPTLVGSTTSGTQTYSVQLGRYVRIGPQVFAHFDIVLSAKDGTTAGDARITGLPFTSSNITGLLQSCTLSEQTSWDLNVAGGFYAVMPYVPVNTTRIDVLEIGDNVSGTNLTAADFGNTSRIAGCAIYLTGIT